MQSARASFDDLIERGPELAAIGQAISAAAGGGAFVLIEGAPGNGKSSLLGAAAEMAEGAGMKVLRDPTNRRSSAGPVE